MRSTILIFAASIFSFCSTTPNNSENKSSDSSLLLKPIIFLIDDHNHNGTKYDGSRCPFYPSCGAYSKKAISEHGFLGLLLAMDRLFYREKGSLESRYLLAPNNLSAHDRYYDPLSDNLPSIEVKHSSFLSENFDKLKISIVKNK